jgi:hypothetical protein
LIVIAKCHAVFIHSCEQYRRFLLRKAIASVDPRHPPPASVDTVYG